jgi:hypothetical protein
MFVVYHRVPLNGRVLSEVSWRLWFRFSLKHSTGCFGSSRSVFMLAFACLPGAIMPVPIHSCLPSIRCCTFVFQAQGWLDAFYLGRK